MQNDCECKTLPEKVRKVDAVINLSPATFRRAEIDEQTTDIHVKTTDFKQEKVDKREEINLSYDEYSAVEVTDEKATKEAKIEIQNNSLALNSKCPQVILVEEDEEEEDLDPLSMSGAKETQSPVSAALETNEDEAEMRDTLALEIPRYPGTCERNTHNSATAGRITIRNG